jgi:aspartate/methionine/tyrosine aminotransferase
MKLPAFRLERFFARYEFAVRHLLCASDCEPLMLPELLALAEDETRSLWERLSLGYTESQGHPLLRQEIAALYPGLRADDILVLAPEEGIFIAMNVLLEPGDHVVVTSPGYQSLYAVAEAIGCTVSRWTPREEAVWRYDPDDLAALLAPATRLLVTNFPHNPTGALPTPDAWARIQALAAERGIRLFSDEMYRFLEHGCAAPLPSACAGDDSAVVLSGLSKAFGLPGLRLGWLATRDRLLLEQMAAFKDYTTICSAAPSEALALMALRAREVILARNRGILRENLALLERFVAAHADLISWARPQGGSVALARLHRIDVDAYCAMLAERAGVLLLPGSAFDWGAGHVRLGYGRRSLGEALAVWGEALAVWDAIP